MSQVEVAVARVGIVVPAFNSARFLSECLDSIRAQTLTDWTCVVVDDGSTDETASIATRFAEADPRIQVVSQPNAGTPRARNAGIEAVPAAVPYLAFLDSDDIWAPDALQVLVDALSGSPEAVGTYGMAELMDSAGRPLAPGKHPSRQRDRRCMARFDLTGVPADEPYTWSGLIVSGTLWPSAVGLHRRSVIDDVGRFDGDLRQVQDWDLYLRMSRRGSFVPVDRQVAWYRQHDANVTSKTERVAYYCMQVRWKSWTSSENTPAQLTEQERVWRRLSARWAIRAGRDGLAAVGHGRRGDAQEAFAASARFLRLLAAGHPLPADERTAGQMARYWG